MSKSLGNVVAPQKVMQQNGAEILRLWVASSDFTEDLRIGPGDHQGRGRFLSPPAQHDPLHDRQSRRLRRTVERIAHADMPELERFVLARLAGLDREVRQGYGEYDFTYVFTTLFNFATTDLSAFYFDIRKDVLYCDSKESFRRRAARTVIDALFTRIVTWLAPLLCFTMEEAWTTRYGMEKKRPSRALREDAGGVDE